MKKEPYAIELYLGEKRSGKTLSMIRDTFLLLKDKPYLKIYSNLQLNKKYFLNYNTITKEELIMFYEKEHEIDNCIFLIDEIHLWFDCRDHATKESKLLSYFLGQLGKRENILRGTTHFFQYLDLRLRLYCEKRIYCYKGFFNDNEFIEVPNYNVKFKDYGLTDNDMIIKRSSIIYKMIGFDFTYIPESITFIKAKPIFELYDSKEIIKRK